MQAPTREPISCNTAASNDLLSWTYWRGVIGRTGRAIQTHNLLLLAAGVAFYTMLAIFPALAALMTLYGLLTSATIAEEHVRALANFLPASVAQFISAQMLRLAAARSDTLSWGFIAALIVSLWGANGAVRSLIAGLNAVYEQRERRGFIKLTLISTAFTLGALVLALLAIAIVSAAPVAAWLAQPGIAAISAWARWPLEALLFYAGLALLYRYGPSIEGKCAPLLSFSTLVVVVVWCVASWGLSVYVTGIANYGQVYGSLAAVIAFLMWTYVSAIVILGGAGLNAACARDAGSVKKS